MPDFGAILRKAREASVLAGATGATGAGAKFLLHNRGGEAAQPGPGSLGHPGPPGPRAVTGPGGPSPEMQPGPAPLRDWREIEQQLREGGPAGPGGPSEKRYVRENAAPRVERTPAFEALPNTPQGWRDGLARLDRAAPPCPGFRHGEWDALHRVIADFMDRHAAEAFTLGWGALDLFGVHHEAGAADVSSCGALMLPWRRNATSLTSGEIRFGTLAYRRRSLTEAVLAWDFAGGAWREGGMAPLDGSAEEMGQ